MQERYFRNLPAISREEQEILNTRRVLIAGCGGLGGYLAEFMARLGVGELTLLDGDVFTPANLNRQLLCTGETLGCQKALAAHARVKSIRPDAQVFAYAECLTAENAQGFLHGRDLALDALDNPESRLILEDACAREGVPLVHGAVQGWIIQAGVSLPGSGFLHRLYTDAGEGDKSCLPFTAALCASVQAAEAVKLLTGREASLAGRVLTLDLERMDQAILPVVSV